MTDAQDDHAATVDAMLLAAGLSVSPGDRRRLLAGYAMLKPGLDALHALPEARYEVPALVFLAAPKLTSWGE